MIKVGISGKIAAGKSEVEKILLEMNYPVYDLDKFSHSLLEDNEVVRKKVLEEFKTLDRKELAKTVFSDLAKKEKLEKIIYPKLMQVISIIFEKHKKDKIVFISGAMLFKSGFYKVFDKMIFVEANDDIRLERLMKRNNLSKQDALNRLNLQDDCRGLPIIIKNNSDMFYLRENTKEALEEIFSSQSFLKKVFSFLFDWFS